MSAPKQSWGPTTLALTDDSYDRSNASDGHSRYGAYLAQRIGDFHEYGEPDTPLPPQEFAAAAWSVATSPIMSPGYVRTRPDLAGITVHLADDGDGLVARVLVPLQHRDLATRLPYNWRQWEPIRYHGDAGAYQSFIAPADRHAAILTTAEVRVLLDTAHLVAQEHVHSRGLVADAKRAVQALVSDINRQVGPMVAALKGER